MADKGFCVHGHFYQPPREDPLTGEIPPETGAEPYPNWNERILAECYRPNALQGNFERISFDIGPTLFEWLLKADPVTATRIVSQDRANVRRFGVGNAMAHPFHHVILPLASRRDKSIQISWGIAEFTERFGRRPEGMWLPETAVDLETLEVMSELGIRYTILAPWQAHDSSVDTLRPQRVDLQNAGWMAVFFYHGGLSSRVSFDPSSTVNADLFAAETLSAGYSSHLESSKDAQLLMIATDGELYGHHQPFRDRFLEHLLDGALSQRSIQATFPALWLKMHPPAQRVRIRENTSWSCHHGLERWRAACGCVPDGSWKAPLRKAMNRLAASLDRLYDDGLHPLGVDPHILLQDFVFVLLGKIDLDELVRSHAARKLDEEEVRRVGLLLKSQYERQRAFTSCGWFFEDFDRIEPKNNIAYMSQAVWLAYLATGISLRSQALAAFSKVKSPRSGLRGDQIFSYHLGRAEAALEWPGNLNSNY